MHNTEVELIERNGVLGVDCDGRFIPAISGGTGAEIALLTVAAVGAAASAYGTYQSVENQRQTLKTQAKIREEDAAIRRMAGEAAAARQRKKDRARLESFGARAGAAGVVAREGSSLLAELDFASDAELEAQHVKYGYELEARRKSIGWLRAAPIRPDQPRDGDRHQPAEFRRLDRHRLLREPAAAGPNEADRRRARRSVTVSLVVSIQWRRGPGARDAGTTPVRGPRIVTDVPGRHPAPRDVHCRQDRVFSLVIWRIC